MHQTFWNVLGLEPTTDERTIKKAYTSRLKTTSPEKDPAGYMKLREAYESAKQYVEMRRHFDRMEELPEEGEPLDTSRAESSAAQENPEPAAESPQQRAFGELHLLLSAGETDEFLKKLAEVKSSDTFASLDDQYFFVGEVARLIQEHQIEDVEWCGRVAELLGAREHENIFEADARYWHAYESLLRSYSESVQERMQAHLEQHWESEVSPGYSHVYHVLTSPFDAERLNALTRSQGYLRLVAVVMERARLDPSIVIPPENREWWVRTAMAGQHRPIAASTVTEPVPEQTGFDFPYWMIVVVMLALVPGIRACGVSHSPGSFGLGETQRSVPLELHRHALSLGGPFGDELMRRLAVCDEKTRKLVITHLYISQAQKHTRADPNDPVVASLLEKCEGRYFFDDEGQLKQLPDTR